MQKIIISRTDNLGDVVLTLPMAGYLKTNNPEVRIYFIGKSYTQPLIAQSTYVDHFLDREEILRNPSLLPNVGADVIIFVYPDKEIAKAAYKADIPVRIGTSHRLFHWPYCNKLVNFSRQNSPLHEAQLNFKLLKPLGVDVVPDLKQIPAWYGLQSHAPEKGFTEAERKIFTIIFHPKSKGSAREWPITDYYALAKLLSPERFRILVTGTEAEGQLIRQQCPQLLTLSHVQDLTGQLTLTQLINTIDHADGLLACSTGPLHIAAALGKKVVGIYPPIKPMHPGRWAPVGKYVKVLSRSLDCDTCRKTADCACIQAISVEEVLQKVNSWHCDC